MAIGNVNPAKVRVTPLAVVYTGRSNVTSLLIEQHNGTKFVPVDLSTASVTRIQLIFPGVSPQILFDSQTTPAAFDQTQGATGILVVDLDTFAIDPGSYVAQLVFFDAAHALGQVIVDGSDNRLQFNFRSVSASGTPPAPVTQWVTEAPTDGQTYGRQNAGWTPITSGNTVQGVADRITVTLAGTVYTVNIAATYAGQASITTLGTITAGIWNGSTIGTAYGGAGATLGILRANGAGTVSAALAGTDYVAPGAITGSGLTMATARLLGRSTAGSGAVEEITVGANLTLSAGVLSATGGGGSALTVQDEGVSLTTAATLFNFVGAGVTVTEPVADQVTVTVPGAPVTSVNSQTGAVVLDTDDIAEGVTNLYHTAARVLATVLSGLSLATGGAIVATDTVLAAFGKIQKQLNDHFGAGGTVHALVTTTVDGFMSAADKVKLNGIEAGAQVNVATDIAQGTRTATTVPVTSSTGADATLDGATTSLAGVMIAADKTKLDAQREILTAARTYYVRTDGSDSNDGLTDSAGGAFLTIQKAVDVATGTLDARTFQVTVRVKDGTYTADNLAQPMLGTLPLIVRGNNTTPANVHVNASTCFATGAAGSRLQVLDMKLTASSVSLLANPGGVIEFGNVEFGSAGARQLSAQFNGFISTLGGYSISGSSPAHAFAAQGGKIRLGLGASAMTITLTGTPAFSNAFAVAQSGLALVTTAGVAPTFSGAGTGKRFAASLNGVINTSGQGLTYFPGDTAGTTESGGLYDGNLAINEAPIQVVASAATVDIGAAGSNTVAISGTTTITSFGTIANGARRTVVFQASLTLTHNATSLILPGGANIITAPGDVASFVSGGSGNWRCHHYQRADGTAVALGPASSPTFTALTLTNGQIAFPAVQVPSGNANTLDDYEEGTWTPTLTFATPGDLSVTYATQLGRYNKIGRVVFLEFSINTSAFTHTTASGVLRITGNPFTSIGAISDGMASAMVYSGVTKASYTSFYMVSSGASLDGRASGSGVGLDAINAADMPTGGTVNLRATLILST